MGSIRIGNLSEDVSDLSTAEANSVLGGISSEPSYSPKRDGVSISDEPAFSPRVGGVSISDEPPGRRRTGIGGGRRGGAGLGG